MKSSAKSTSNKSPRVSQFKLGKTAKEVSKTTNPDTINKSTSKLSELNEDEIRKWFQDNDFAINLSNYHTRAFRFLH